MATTAGLILGSSDPEWQDSVPRKGPYLGHSNVGKAFRYGTVFFADPRELRVLEFAILRTSKVLHNMNE